MGKRRGVGDSGTHTRCDDHRRRFLIPYRSLLWAKYATDIALFGGVLFINLFSAFYAIGRKLFLKDTGRKLAHLEKELRSGSISEELRRRLQE